METYTKTVRELNTQVDFDFFGLSVVYLSQALHWEAQLSYRVGIAFTGMGSTYFLYVVNMFKLTTTTAHQLFNASYL